VVLVVVVVLVGGSRFHMVTMVIGGWLLDVSDG
jgi:coenzyme F420-reducing hydrogenase alpha subunit